MEVKEWSPVDRESFTTPGGPFQAPAGERARSYSFTRAGSREAPATLRPAPRTGEAAPELSPRPWYAETQEEAETPRPVMMSHDGETPSAQPVPQVRAGGPRGYTVQPPRQPQGSAAQAPKKSLWWAPLLLIGSLLLGLVLGALLYPSLSKHWYHSDSGQSVPEGGESAGARIYREQADAVAEIRAYPGDSAETTGKVSIGTGFFIAPEYVLTNYHVVGEAERILVTLRDGSRMEAHTVGREYRSSDLALLRVEGSAQKTVSLGDSDSVRVGDQVFTIGHPMGELTFVLSSGYLSAEARTVNTGDDSISMMQINASVNKGNSGGPLFDAQGRVIGIVTAKYSTGVDDNGVKTSLEGLGFAIPINDAMALAKSWMEQAATGNKQ